LTRLAPSADDYIEHASIFYDGASVEARAMLAKRTAAGYERHVHAQFEASNRAEKAARAHNARARAGKFGGGGGGGGGGASQQQRQQRASTTDELVPPAGEPKPGGGGGVSGAGGMMEARLAQLQKEEEGKRADAAERSRLNAARRMLAQRAARSGRYGAHDEGTLGGAAGVERRLKMHNVHASARVAGLENFEREEVVREVEVEEDMEAAPPPPPPPRRSKAKKTPTPALQPKARTTWMSAAVETRWPQPDVAPARTCDRESSHRRSPSPAEAGKRRAAYVAPTPTSSSHSVISRHQRQQGGDAHRGGREHSHPSPAPPPNPASPASLSATEAARVRELIAHSRASGSSGAPGPTPPPPSMMPPFTLASLRLLEVAHPSLRAQHAVLQRVTPGAVLRRWAAFLAVADEDDLSGAAAAAAAAEEAAEEATRRRLARRMGGMLVAFGAWAATAAASTSAAGASASASAADAEGKLLANHALADLSRDAEKHGAWMKSAVSEWRGYRASWQR
jgi:hypothetical protein